MDYALARKSMVDGQLTPNKINNKDVLAAFSKTPREFFVEVTHKSNAYVDSYVNLTPERKMMPPMLCARLIQELNVTKEDKVLVLAAGSGYSSVILASLAKEVHAVEENMSLYEMAKRSCYDAKCKTVRMHEGKPELGLAAYAPFDKILIDSPVEFIPNQLWEQLAEGGRLTTVEKTATNICEGVVYSKEGKDMNREVLFEAGGSVLKNFKQPKSFQF